MADDVKMFGETLRGTPSPSLDGTTRQLRADANGELITRPRDRHILCAEGNYYTLGTAPGTGIAGHAAATTLDDTKPYVWLKCGFTAADKKRIHLDYLKTWVTAAGTGGTDLRYGIKIDTGSDRRSSAGTLMTSTNTCLQSTNTATVTAYQGAVVAAAASTSVRIVSHGLVRTVINVVGDEYMFKFGGDPAAASAMISAGTAQYKSVHHVPAISLGPNDQFLFHFFSTSQSAASSHEAEIGFWVE